jgi:hypothetical protein
MQKLEQAVGLILELEKKTAWIKNFTHSDVTDILY